MAVMTSADVPMPPVAKRPPVKRKPAGPTKRK